jgi:DNA repair and recombination protein RAD54B
MARCWRDGQKRPVHIYRLCSTGTLEENMLQRQAEKASLSNAMMVGYRSIDSGFPLSYLISFIVLQNEGQTGKSSKQQKFTQEELRKIFRFNKNTLCATHEALKCYCHLEKPDSEDDDEADSSSEDQDPKKVHSLSYLWADRDDQLTRVSIRTRIPKPLISRTNTGT